MKIKKYELCIMLVTVLVIGFGIGFFTGRSNVIHSVSISPLYAPVSGTEYGTHKPDGSAAEENGTEHRININTADKHDFCKINGINEDLAEKIIEYRRENGSFVNIYMLKKVPEIDDALFEKIKDRITTK